jgi:hypothetical protein
MKNPWVIVALGAVTVIPTLCQLIEKYKALCPEGRFPSNWISPPPPWIENSECMTPKELEYFKSLFSQQHPLNLLPSTSALQPQIPSGGF